jgi:putative membrane protein insertion efficiency factor
MIPSGIRSLFNTALGLPLIGLIWGYRVLLGPIFPTGCRFDPSCSTYGIEAIRRHGPFLGSWLTLRRLLRCHPWGGMGYDPVPERPIPSRSQTAAHRDSLGCGTPT